MQGANIDGEVILIAAVINIFDPLNECFRVEISKPKMQMYEVLVPVRAAVKKIRQGIYPAS